MDRVEFFVDGLPATQGNHRVGRGGHIYDSNPNLRAWRTLVTYAARATRVQFDGAVAVQLGFYLIRPKNERNVKGEVKDWAGDVHTKKPDLDKLIRPIFDSLSVAGMIGDDARITKVIAEKWKERDTRTGVKVIVEGVAEQ